MARVISCDGCGGQVAEPIVVGHVIKRDYCEECAKSAEAFLAAEEDNRAHFHRRFAEIRENLIKVHGMDGAFKLPDVP